MIVVIHYLLVMLRDCADLLACYCSDSLVESITACVCHTTSKSFNAFFLHSKAFVEESWSGFHNHVQMCQRLFWLARKKHNITSDELSIDFHLTTDGLALQKLTS